MPRPLPINPQPLITKSTAKRKRHHYASQAAILLAGLILVCTFLSAIIIAADQTPAPMPTRALYDGALHQIIEEITVRGRIMAEGRPIPDASIAIASYAPSISSLSGDSFIVWTTDENGYFEGTIVFNSWVYYSIGVSALGCDSLKLDVQEFFSQTESQTISLTCPDRQ